MGIARDLSGRGWRVVLCEQDDLGAHTSSNSTKLIHGGLRYLEHYEFGLVRKALRERDLLLRLAPHIIWPLNFIMPYDPSMRPAWMIYMGLYLYDILASGYLPAKSHAVNLRTHPTGQALKELFTKGFIYADAWVDDARLVVLNAVDAAQRGASVLTRTRCEHVQVRDGAWSAQLRSQSGALSDCRATVLVNAAGPWAEGFLKQRLQVPPNSRQADKSLRLIKGSHIVIRKIFDHPCAYIFQNLDKRITFAIPYEDEFTLIGTTDVECSEFNQAAQISEQEVEYLCAQVNRYFKQTISKHDVIWQYSGVRPLLEDESGNPAEITRDYTLDLSVQNGPPMLTVWGGKITTYRKLSEEAAALVEGALGRTHPAWTARTPLPGGDLAAWVVPSKNPQDDFESFKTAVQIRYPWLDNAVVARLCRLYGTRVEKIIQDAAKVEDLGPQVVSAVYEAELRYLIDFEWARTAEDILWRRTKLGLHLTKVEQETLANAFYALLNSKERECN